MLLSFVGADIVGPGGIVGFVGALGGDIVGAGGIVGRVCCVWTDVTLCGVVEGAIGVEAVGRVSTLPPSGDVLCGGFADPIF